MSLGGGATSATLRAFVFFGYTTVLHFPHKVLRALLCITLTGTGSAALSQNADPVLEQVLVSASRAPQPSAELALSWSRITSEEIGDTAAVHINQLMQRSAGVWISRGNGQESLPSLRSPVLTGAGGCGAFFMAWDGIALRAPGFCNVNQLFDVNSEQAGAVEVIRGPGTAVFGANALHGVINTLSASPTTGPGQRYAVEAGPNDYYRLRGELRKTSERQSLGLYINAASDGGYANDSGFEQQKMTLRHDYTGTNWDSVSAFEVSNLNQETAGFVPGFEAYKDPQLKRSNPNPEAYRDSYALRAYSRWERSTDVGALSITPYLRRTGMSFLQHFLPWQPEEKNGQDGLGLQLALRGEREHLSWQWGVDVDSTRARLSEVQAEVFSPNQPAGVHYDYQVDALSLAVYGQTRWQLADRWILSAGLRGEFNGYDYDNQASTGSACEPTASNCRFFRPADQRDDFLNGSANLGLSYMLNDSHHLYVRAAQGFRPPQAAELYRLQSGQDNAELDGETMFSVDAGLRGTSGSLSYDVSLFSMRKRDVIFQDANRQNVSGANTRHEGVEFSLRWQSESGWFAGLAGTLARHRYDSNASLLGSRLDIDGNDIDTAPRHYGSARIGYDTTLAGTRSLTGELEWVHMGRYYLEPDNLHSYDGHELLNLRMTLALPGNTSASLRITNLLDEDYAERADFGFGSYRYFIGQSRGAYLELAWALP